MDKLSPKKEVLQNELELLKKELAMKERKLMKMERAFIAKKRVHEKNCDKNKTLKCSTEKSFISEKKEIGTAIVDSCKVSDVCSEQKINFYKKTRINASDDKYSFCDKNSVTPSMKEKDSSKISLVSKVFQRNSKGEEISNWNKAKGLHLKNRITKTGDSHLQQFPNFNSNALQDIVEKKGDFVCINSDSKKETNINVANKKSEATNVRNFANAIKRIKLSKECNIYAKENNQKKTLNEKKELYDCEINGDIDIFHKDTSISKLIDHTPLENLQKINKSTILSESNKFLPTSPLKCDQNVELIQGSNATVTTKTLYEQNSSIPDEKINCSYKFSSGNSTSASSNVQPAMTVKLYESENSNNSSKVDVSLRNNYLLPIFSPTFTSSHRRSQRLSKRHSDFGAKTNFSCLSSPPRKRRNSTGTNSGSVYSYFFDWLLLNCKSCENIDFDLPYKDFGILKEAKLRSIDSSPLTPNPLDSVNISTSHSIIHNLKNIDKPGDCYLNQSDQDFLLQNDSSKIICSDEKQQYPIATVNDLKFLSGDFKKSSDSLVPKSSESHMLHTYNSNDSHRICQSPLDQHAVSEIEDLEMIFDFSCINLQTQEDGQEIKEDVQEIQNSKNELGDSSENYSTGNVLKSYCESNTLSSVELPNVKRPNVRNSAVSDISGSYDLIDGKNELFTDLPNKDLPMTDNISVQRSPEISVPRLSPVIFNAASSTDQDAKNDIKSECCEFEDDCITPSLFHQMEMYTQWETDCEELKEPCPTNHEKGNFSFIKRLNGQGNEPVHKIHLTLVNEVPVALIQYISDIEVWKQASENQWVFGGSYNVGKDSKILDSCVLKNCEDHIMVLMFITNEKQSIKFFYIAESLKEMKVMEPKEWLSNGNIGKNAMLCGLQCLTFATAVGDEVFSVYAHIFEHTSDSSKISSLELSTVSDSLLNLCAIDELPKALLGCSLEALYIWNYVIGCLVTIVSLTPVPSERFSNCVWAKSEKGLLYLLMTVLGQECEHTCQLIVVNPETGLWDCIQKYIHEGHQQSMNKNCINQAVLGRYVFASCCQKGFLWDLYSGFNIGSLKSCNVTCMMSVSGFLAVGLQCGCTNLYHMSDSKL